MSLLLPSEKLFVKHAKKYFCFSCGVAVSELKITNLVALEERTFELYKGMVDTYNTNAKLTALVGRESVPRDNVLQLVKAELMDERTGKKLWKEFKCMKSDFINYWKPHLDLKNSSTEAKAFDVVRKHVWASRQNRQIRSNNNKLPAGAKKEDEVNWTMCPEDPAKFQPLEMPTFRAYHNHPALTNKTFTVPDSDESTDHNEYTAMTPKSSTPAPKKQKYRSKADWALTYFKTEEHSGRRVCQIQITDDSEDKCGFKYGPKTATTSMFNHLVQKHKIPFPGYVNEDDEECDHHARKIRRMEYTPNATSQCSRNSLNFEYHSAQKELASRTLQRSQHHQHHINDNNNNNHHHHHHLGIIPHTDMEFSPDFKKHEGLAKQVADFLTESPDPFHAIHNLIKVLKSSNYEKLDPSKPFTGRLKPGNRYYYALNGSTLVAFAVGNKYKKGNGFKIVGGHTDSPNLKVKPNSKRDALPFGCTQLAVECYGGGLWHTWFDRDLGISGRVLVRNAETDKIEQKLIKITTPVARVSTLCIHLQSAEERAAFKVNKEDHLSPIISSTIKKKHLQASATEQLNGSPNVESSSWHISQEPLLLKRIASDLGLADVNDIADFELNLFDVQPATLGGMENEFIYSARLDNLATCFVATEAITYFSDNYLEDDEDISMILLFDHEEIGSTSAEGAGSPAILEALKRISAALADGDINPDLYASSIQKSFLFSVDMAHAIHPNWSSKHEKGHAPLLNNGVTIKTNRNQRYSTNTITGFVVRELTRIANLTPVQEFVVRNDCACGSTIGPILSAKTGIRTCDAGMPQLSMHSCREMMGVADLTNGLEMFKAFFKHFREIDNKLTDIE